MMRLRWTRTVLCALGFVWVMLAWHLHEREHSKVTALITRLCADRGEQRARDECEADFRSAGLGGGGLSVNGSVEVSGSVDVNQ